MLGHPVEFSYCRTTGSDSLCRKILDCWWEEFLVWDMGTPDYNSGWFSVSKGTTYQKAHGLSGNLDDLLVFVEVSESNDGTGRRVCSNGCAFDATSRNVQCAAVKIDQDRAQPARIHQGPY